MKEYFQLFRPIDILLGIIGAIGAAVIATNGDLEQHMSQLLILSAVIFLYVSGGNSINDYTDRHIDILAHPERPIPSGKIKAKTVLHLGFVMLVAACLLSLLFDHILSTLIVIVASILLAGYELSLKKYGLMGNMTIALLTGMAFILGASIVGNHTSCYFLAIVVFIITLAREISMDITDAYGDEGRFTIPRKIGRTNASIVSSVIYFVSAILMIFLFSTNNIGAGSAISLISVLLLIGSAILVFRDSRTAERLAKLALLTVLLTFVIFAVI